MKMKEEDEDEDEGAELGSQLVGLGGGGLILKGREKLRVLMRFM